MRAKLQRRSSFFLITLAAAFAIGCATPPPPQWKPLTQAELGHPLALQECIELAWKSDVRTAEWKARIAAARAELITAKSIPNPTFQATWEDVGIHAAGIAQQTTAYGFAYPIFFWWTRPKEIAVAKSKLLAEDQSVQGDQRQLSGEIGASYFGLLAAARKVKATEELLAGAKEALRLAEESFKLGAVAKHDVDLARTEVEQASAELFDARHEQHAQALAFAFALGADRPIAVEVQEAAFDLSSLGWNGVDEPSPAPPEALLARGLEVNTDYAGAKAEREAAEASLQLEQRRLLPLSEAQASGAVKHTPDGRGGLFSLDIPIPLFNWNRGGIKKAEAGLLAAQTKEEKARRTVAQHIADGWEGYTTASQRYSLFAEKITNQRKKLAEDAKELFGAGQISYTELLLARHEWRQAELDAVDFWRQRMVSAWKLLTDLADPVTLPKTQPRP